MWGSATPRPPPLMVQPKGGWSWSAGSRVHGGRVPGGEQLAARPGRTRAQGRSARARWPGGPGGRKCGGRGQPPGEPRARPHPGGIAPDPGTSPGGGWSAGRKVTGSVPFPGAGTPGGRGRGPLEAPALLSWWLRTPLLLLISAWGGEPWAPRGLRACGGRLGVRIRRKGCAGRKGWTLEPAKRQKRLQGPGGWGWGGGGVE